MKNGNVSKRRGIPGHKGNYTRDTKGCILFGLDSEGKTIQRSTDAMILYRKYFDNKQTIKLIIR